MTSVVNDNEIDQNTTNDGSLIERQPLFPKTNKEKLVFVRDISIIPLLLSGLTGSCPAIRGEVIFLVCYGSVTIISTGLGFYYSFDRPGHDQVYSKEKKVKDFLGLFQMLTGVYGMFLIFPNLHLFNNASPDTCEMGTLISLLIPSCIMVVVIIVLLSMGAHFLWKKHMYPASTKYEQHDEGGDDEYVALS